MESTELAGEARVRLAEISADIADAMGVVRYEVGIDWAGDSRIGAAYSAPSTGQIMTSELTAIALDDDELERVLAHEFGHLVVPEPAVVRHRRRVRAVAIAIGLVVGVLAGTMLLSVAREVLAAPWAAIPVGALTGVCLAWAGAEIWYARVHQRYELACDIEGSHAVGCDGLSVLRYDPALRQSRRIEQWLATHPATEVRAQAIRAHANRAGCGCAPRATVEFVGEPQ